MANLFKLIFVCVLFVESNCLAATRIAFLPSFSDFELQSGIRSFLPAFDARLQAELLDNWDAEILSRAGLSTVVFEQKLRAATDPSAASFHVLPSDYLVFTILDQPKKQLRVFITPVGKNMSLGKPRIFKVRNHKQIATRLPTEVAKYVAKVTGLGKGKPPAAADGGSGKPLVCALLEPIATGGESADLGNVSPLIRIVLEDVIASDDIGISLVDRSQTTTLLSEKTLTGVNRLDPNNASSLGRMAKADLILIPFISFQTADKVTTDLFAIDVTSGRMLACASWSGGLLDPPGKGAVEKLIGKALLTVKDTSAQQSGDEAAKRHAEADFIVSLKEGWAGLRQSAITEAELAVRLGDASIALASDNPELMRKAVRAFYRDATPTPAYPLLLQYDTTSEYLDQFRAWEKSGQLDLVHNQAREVFELPMTELAEGDADIDLQRLGALLTRLGRPKEAWNVLTRTGEPVADLFAKSPYYQTLVVALMNDARYQDVIDSLERRQRWSSMCTPMILDAYRALGKTDREFSLMALNSSSTCKTVRMATRYLELGTEQGKAAEVLADVLKKANSWIISNPAVRTALIRTRVAAGQKQEATSDAQCALLSAAKTKDTATEKEMRSLLTELGAEPLAKLPPARNFLKLPADCYIDFIHDQTIKPEFASDVASRLATFWGCPVHVRAVDFNATKLSTYNKVSKAFEGNTLAEAMIVAPFFQAPSLGTVFLTNHKLLSKQKNYVGDIYSASRGSLTILSDNYFRKYSQYDKRPLPQVTAIAAASLNSVSREIRRLAALPENAAQAYRPSPPDVFSSNGDLHMASLDLGVSPLTGAFLEKISLPRLLQSIPAQNATYRERAINASPADRRIASSLNKQLSETDPIIIKP